MTFLDYIAAEPTLLRIWINWLGFINIASIAFIWTRVEPRWILAAFLASLVTMNFLFSVYGYDKILGLSHVIFWTPLLIYLFLRRHEIGRYGLTAVYLGLLFASNFISLMVDYFDVMIFLLRGPQG